MLGAELLQQAELQSNDGGSDSGSDSGSQLELEDGEDAASDDRAGPAEEGALEMPAARQAETAERPEDDGLDSDVEAVLEVITSQTSSSCCACAKPRLGVSERGGKGRESEDAFCQSSRCVIHLTQEFSTSKVN